MLNLLRTAKEENIELKRPILPILILLAVIVGGTFGYGVLWQDTNSNWLDHFYMTFITITTIGYEEVYPLDSIGRIFTIAIGVLGIGSLFYVLSIFMENLFIIQLHNIRGKKKMEKKIAKLSDHIILIGYGRVGSLAAKVLNKHNETLVIVEENLGGSEDEIEKEGNFFIVGDATEDETLIKAGIERARGIIVTTANSATTVFVVLSAKVLKPDLHIVARADEESSVTKLEKAGANQIVNPYSIGGMRLAQQMVNPNVVEFMESSLASGDIDISVDSVMLPANSKWNGKTLIELDIRKKCGASVLAIIRNGQSFMNPNGQFKILAGDRVLVMGTKEQTAKFEKIALNGE